ncbi:MAG: hypothetical protein ACRDRV_01765 [Pseudonocardiaceae bacterium]
MGSGRRVRVLDVLDTAEQVTGRPVPVRHRPSADEPPILLADPDHAGSRRGAPQL